DAFPFASGTGLPKALEPWNSCTEPVGVPLPPLTVDCRYMPIPSIVPPTVGYGELRTTRVVVDAACALTAARECAGTTSSVSVAIAVASATARSRAPIRVSRDIYASVPTVLLEAVDACSGAGVVLSIALNAAAAIPAASRPRRARMASGLACGMYLGGEPSVSTVAMGGPAAS